MEDEVFLYSEDNEAADYFDLSQRFGTPESVAAEFLNNLDGDTVAKTALFRNKVLISSVAVIILMSLTICIHRIYIQHTLLDSVYIESITYEEALTPDITGPTYFHEEGTSNQTIP